MFSSLDLEKTLATLRPILWQALEQLRQFYRQVKDLTVQDKGGDPVTLADQQIDAFLRHALQEHFPASAFGYLTEETYTAGQPLSQPYVWIIDPLDGTYDFLQQTGEYAIHVALVHKHRPCLAAVVWPEQEVIYTAIAGGGTYRETRHSSTRLQVQPPSPDQPLRVVMSRSHGGDRLEAFLTSLGSVQLMPMGSMGCKTASICQGDADLYVSLTGGSAPKDWDLAAPDLIMQEAAGAFTYVNGELPRYNRADVQHWQPLVVCHPVLSRWVGDRLQAFLQENQGYSGK
ncbi:3'(2'),5'-bisphosphate nucleotidase CysQ [Thermosynechococcus sp. OHK43]|uniref:3'(2'),5'-bisphosphate nucleotidase CysQ n=1 Tax=Thermosynechococcus sp. OHK43 TaxID=2763133 RepID=UPI000F2288CF|nr:3'(2'),5'-bisphosphate nucleotidase CysQ [Thermosynechococcus sp. OHK43]RMH66458.1 MAG: 3'(2'),5'-bisphosphate nucleotidase CysQ [Cyanobacteria bacterium J003]